MKHTHTSLDVCYESLKVRQERTGPRTFHKDMTRGPVVRREEERALINPNPNPNIPRGGGLLCQL